MYVSLLLAAQRLYHVVLYLRGSRYIQIHRGVGASGQGKGKESPRPVMYVSWLSWVKPKIGPSTIDFSAPKRWLVVRKRAFCVLTNEAYGGSSQKVSTLKLGIIAI